MGKEELEAEFRAEIREHIKELRDDVKRLIGFRAWLLGAAATVSAIVTLAIDIFVKK